MNESTEAKIYGRVMLLCVPEDKVTKGSGAYYWVNLGEPLTFMKMDLMVIAKPGEAVASKGRKEAEE